MEINKWTSWANGSDKHVTRLAWIYSFFLGMPVLLTRFLPFFDYYNHLARYALLGNFQNSQVFKDYYQVNDKFIPNLGFDLLATNLTKLLPVETVGQIILFFSLFAGSLGFCYLSFSIHGKKTLFALVPSIFLVSFSLTFGFNNNILAMAIFPWALYSLHRFFQTGSTRLVATYVVLVVLTFICHAFVAALVLAFSFLLSLTCQESKIKIARRLTYTLLPLLVLIPILLASPTSGEFKSIHFGPITHKLKMVYLSFFTGTMWADVIFLLLVLTLLYQLIFFEKPILNMSGKAAVACAGIAFIVCPMGLAVASNLDGRLVPLFASILFTFLTPVKRVQPVTAVLILCTLAFRVSTEAVTIRAASRVIANAAYAIEQLPSSALVFVIVSDSTKLERIQDWSPPVLNLAFAGALHRPIFISALYTYPNQQPIVCNSLGSKLSYAGGFEATTLSIQEQLTKHLTEIRARLNSMPAEYFVDHPPFIFIGRTEESEIDLPDDLIPIHSEPKFMLVMIKPNGAIP